MCQSRIYFYRVFFHMWGSLSYDALEKERMRWEGGSQKGPAQEGLVGSLNSKPNKVASPSAPYPPQDRRNRNIGPWSICFVMLMRNCLSGSGQFVRR